jgi:hypothetical protein
MVAMNEQSMRPTDLALAFLVAAVVVAASAGATAVAGHAAGWSGAGWAALHLVLLGGVSLLVIGISQFFVTAFLATTPPSRRLVFSQISCWVAGSVAVVTGVSLEIDPLTVAGVALLLAALLLYARSLATLHSRSLQSAPWASRWYVACGIWLLGGIALGLMLALQMTWSHGSLLGAHLAFNLCGWLGGAIVGTLHTFAPSLTQTMLRFPRLQPVTFGFWSGGIGSMALGYAFGSGDLVIVGWSLLTLGAGLLAVNLLASALAAEQPLSLPARLVVWSQVFLPLGLGFGLVSSFDHPLAPLFGGDRTVLAVLLLVGWVGLTVIGSMLHLLSVVVRVRDLTRPVAAPNRFRDAFLAAVALAAVALLALAEVAEAGRLAELARGAMLLVAVTLTSLVVRSVVLALRMGPKKRPG